MAWYFQWSDAIKKRACRYLLQRYLGQYLQEKLTLNQLSVDLYNGTGTITDLNMDVEALNEMADMYNLPIEFVDGYIRSISVCIPWSTLLKDSSFVEVQGLMATIQPKQRSGSVSVMNSMWGSMTTSMQLAEECLRQDQADAADNVELSKPFEGLERFAQTIESVLCRIKVRFVDTTFRLEHVPKSSSIGVALELRIKKVDFFDEAGTENGGPTSDVERLRNVHEPAAFSCKNFHLEGVTFHTDEFPSKARTFSKSVISMGSSPETKNAEMFATAPDTPDLGPLGQQSVFESCFTTTESNSNLLNLATQSDPILVAKLSGRHEIRLKAKLCESIPGPRVSIDCSLGSVVIFCSPRQVHVLLELCSGLVSPDLEDDSNMCRRYAATSKPMQASDFKKVEQELQKHLTPHVQGRSLHQQQGWSSQSLDDSDDEFHPIDGSEHRMTASITSNASSQVSDADSMTSSSTRYSPGSTGGNLKGRRQTSHHGPSLHLLVVDDALSESTYFKTQLSSLVVVVLHDNVLSLAASGHGLVTRSSVAQMKAQGEAFFSKLGVFSLSDRDLESAHKKLSSVCQANHLRFVAAPFTFEGTEKTSSSVRNLHCSLSVGTAELTECLFDNKSFPSHPVRPEYTTLLGFKSQHNDTNKFQSSGFPSWSLIEPCIKIKLTHWEHLTVNSVRLRRVVTPPPRTEIHVEMASCNSELDITIVDRISGLLDQKDLCGRPVAEHRSSSTRQPPTNHGFLMQAMEEEAASGDGRRLDLSVSASKATVSIRFPIPDMRPLHDMERMPWWKRSVRNDILTLEIVDARLRSTFVSGETSQTFDFTCRELHGLFQEKSDDPPVSFLHASAGNGDNVVSNAHRDGFSGDGNNDDEGFDWPRLTLKIFPPTPALALEEQESDESDDPMQTSSLETLVHNLCSSDGAEPTPFSTRKIIYKSDQTGNDEAEQNGGQRRHQENTMDSEQMILPGERSEVAEFIERSAANSQFVVEINLANVNIVLPSKHFYEVLYNRISTDLMLWQRAAPRPVAKDPSGFRPPPLNHDWANNYMHDTVYETFSMCKSARHDDTSSESDGDQRPSHATYGEHKRRQTRHQRRTTSCGRLSSVCFQNRVCFTLTCKDAAVTLRSPLTDGLDKVSSEHHGELQLQVSDLLFFIVSTSPNSLVDSYMCLHANKTAIYHHGCLLSSPADLLCRVSATRQTAPGHLLPTLHQSEPGARTKHVPNSQNSDATDMLMVAIRVSLDMVQRVKTFRVAVGVRDATLRHFVSPTSSSWYKQLVEFFDVLDYPVVGYQTPEVITELHLHTWGCAVDYRPINLPLRVILAVDTFSICSNIAAQTSTSVVRVLLEDVYLFFSKNLEAPVVDLRKDYVCVVDVGFFELSLRLTDSKDHRLPKVDLRASNNMLHIRTCVDSFRALQDLIGYLACDGDLRDDQTFSAANSELSLNEESDLSTLTTVEAEQVHDLMAEAMKESVGSSRASSECENTTSKSELSATGEVFLFPDEARRPTTTSGQAIPRHSKRDDESQSSPSGDSLDDDFCILENDPGVGIVSLSGEPQVRILTSQPINIVENHFSVPVGRIDQLKAPKYFPTPTLRYTLNEISLVWHLFGGNDFPSADGQVNGEVLFKGQETKSGSPNFRDTRNVGVAFSKVNTGDVHFRTKSSPTKALGPSSSDSLTWRTNGGPGRQLDVLVELQLNKVRFRHEKYPDNTEQASRQILLIHEVEIRDRLASSQMNKFLYLYSSETMPRQSHANMVVVNALHLRSDPSGASEECALKVSLLPLRLNIDQDALFFLYRFFGAVSSGGRSEVAPCGTGDGDIASTKAPSTSPTTPAPIQKGPVMSVTAVSPPKSLTANFDSPGVLDSHQNLMFFEDSGNADQQEHDMRVRFSGVGTNDNYDAASVTSSSTVSSSSTVFFRSFVFSPEVPIRLDYHGKRVDMEQGALAGLLIGLGQLNSSELRLKRLSYRHGLLGVDRLLTYALTEWLHDIRQTQLPGVLGGVGPFHSLVQLFQGCRDLFWLPIEQYRKDGRIIRGLQRGANAFTTSTAMAALELANRLVQAVQCTAETAYDVVSPGPSVRASRAAGYGRAGSRRIKRPSQPADIREGMANALQVVKEGIGDTARTIVQVASEEHEHKGISGAVGGVLRQIPPTVVKPIILATEATSNVLGGMRHQLAPDVRREAAEKWRSDDD